MTGRKLKAGRHLKKSHFACSTCKSRKLKCDEARPSCARCLKAGRSCEYQDTAPFKIVQPSSSPQRGSLPKTHKNTPSASNIDLVWVNDVDTAGHTEAAPPSPEEDPAPAVGSTVSPPAASSATLKSNLAPVENVYGGEVERLMSLRLTRHFKESPAQWMDAFDTASYFSCKAPVRAASSTLLKSSMCALAAKHLYRLQSASKDQNTLAAKSFVSDDELHMDWEWYAAHYYDKAIRCLKAAINSITFNPDLPENAVEQECIFAAVAILSTYELIDAPGTAWKAHLGVLPVFNPSSLSHSTPSYGEHSQAVIHKPIFWCLARQDFLCAFISETQTRLNLNDRRLWQNAGLAVDDDGVRLPLSPSSSTNAYASAADVEEDRQSNKLTWLLSKIVNHLTSGDALWPEDYAKPLGQRCPVGVTQEQLLDRWYALMGELDGWYSGLVPSFKPVATAPYTGPEGSGAASGLVKTWFEIPLCAATMQSYHMARILLLVNRPQESTAIRSTVSARLRSYRDAIEQALYHSRQICGISLARPADPVRIHLVQPLFVAGQVFHTENEQRVVLSLLSGIESDLGWSTSYHIKKLGQEWSTAGDVY